MTKDILKFSLIGILAGASIGGALAWFLTNRKANDKIDELERKNEFLKNQYDKLFDKWMGISKSFDEAREEIRELYSAVNALCDQNLADAIKELVATRRTVAIMRSEGATEEEITEATIRGDQINQYRSIISDLGYTPYKRKGDPIDDDVDGQHWDEENDELNEEDDILRYEDGEDDESLNPEPYLISDFEFITSDLDKLTFTYYSLDDVLMDDQDQDILDQNDLGVTDLLTHFSDLPLYECAIYIRNERRRIEYEIIWDDDSYQHAVLGLRDEDDSTSYEEDDRKVAVNLPRIFRKATEG